jgi:hypothetical protein
MINITDKPVLPKTLCNKSTTAAMEALLKKYLSQQAYDHLVSIGELGVNIQRAYWVTRLQEEWQFNANAGVPEANRLQDLIRSDDRHHDDN